MTTRRDIDAARQDLTVGLHTVSEINHTIRYADTKAAALATIQALAVTVLAARRADSAGVVSDILFGACLAAVLTSTALLAFGQVPRVSSGRPAERPNRLAFPSLVTLTRAETLAVPSLRAQRQDVWRQAADLADIAATKFRWLHRAMVSTVSTLAAVLLWLGVTTWFR